MSRGAALAVAAVAALAGPAEEAFGAPRCPEGQRCLRVSVPLDRSGLAPGRLSLRVRVLPAARRPAPRGVLVALAGGPGQAAVPYARDLRASLGAAGREFDVVVLDQRGTGGSGRLACRLRGEGYRASAAAVTACGRRLGARAGAYTTRDSVADLEAVRRRLRAPRITVFGVSYGTKVAQGYAARHPRRTRALVLDSVLGLGGPDPFSRATFAALPAVLRDLCTDGACRRATPAPVADLGRVARRLERRPAVGTAYDRRGRPRRVRLTAVDLLDLLVMADLDPLLGARLPGAVRSAALGDAAPLLRLAAETPLEDLEEAGGDSTTLYYATVCEETRFPWARTAAPAARRAAALAAFSARDRLFAPFGWRTALAVSDAGACAGWPARPAAPALPARLPDVPALLLAGAQDLRTPASEARRVARRLPRSRLLVVPGLGHSVASTSCPARAIAAFLRGRRFGPCPRASAPPARPRVPRRLAAVRPLGAPGLPGRVAAAAVLTLGDAAFGELVGLVRRRLGGGGLRGGAWTVRDGCLRLLRMRDVAGVAVTTTGCGPTLRVDGPGRLDGRLVLARGGRIRGRIGGRPVAGRAGAVDPLLGPPGAAVRPRVRPSGLRRAG